VYRNCREKGKTVVTQHRNRSSNPVFLCRMHKSRIKKCVFLALVKGSFMEGRIGIVCKIIHDRALSDLIR
jgi:hypothetical protein